MDSRSDGYEIVAYRPEFRNQLLELQTRLWSPDLARNAAYLDWKYFDNPYAKMPIISLALHAGQVVGTVAAFPTCWEAGSPGQAFHCFLMADAIVDPDHRRHALLTKMTIAVLHDLCDRDVKHVFAFTSNPYSSACFLKLGWRRASSMQIALARPKQAQSSGLRRLAHSLPLLPSLYRQLRRAMQQPTASSAGAPAAFEAFDRNSARFGTDRFAHICVEDVPRPEAMAELVQRIGHDGRMRQVRDQCFFEWRFQNPLSVYRFLFWQDVRLEGYLVLQRPVGAAEDSWTSIVDWEASTTEARVELLQAARQLCESEVLAVWSATLTNLTKTLLGESGFHFLEEADSLANGLACPSVLVRSACDDGLDSDWTDDGRRLLQMANWDVRAIYTDDY